MKMSRRSIGYVLVLVAAAAAALYFYTGAGVVGKGVEVPSLVGKEVTASSETLNRIGLSMNIEGKEYNAEFAAGLVIRQTAAPGNRLPAGGKIGVFVSMGPEVYSMPSFDGQSLDDARLTLLNLGVKLNKVTWVHSDIVEKGRIVAQRPLAGNIERNEINFLVSRGPYPVSYRCPSFVNMTTADARALARELGIVLVEKKDGSRVVFQKPEAESVINKGDQVEVTLGRGWGMWF